MSKENATVLGVLRPFFDLLERMGQTPDMGLTLDARKPQRGPADVTFDVLVFVVGGGRFLTCLAFRLLLRLPAIDAEIAQVFAQFQLFVDGALEYGRYSFEDVDVRPVVVSYVPQQLLHGENGGFAVQTQFLEARVADRQPIQRREIHTFRHCISCKNRIIHQFLLTS